jgi:hypothetical protein
LPFERERERKKERERERERGGGERKTMFFTHQNNIKQLLIISN